MPKQLPLTPVQIRAVVVPPPLQAPASVGAPQQEGAPNKAPSNTRFRSFAERYIMERAKNWPEGKEIELAWETISQARTIYNMIKEQGRTLKDDT